MWFEHNTVRAGAVFALALFVGSLSQPVAASEIETALSGRTAFESGKAYRPWRQFFGADGTTVYFGDGPSSLGLWEVRGKQYCSLWPPAKDWACYEVKLSPEAAPFTSIIWIAKDGSKSAADLFDGDQTQLRTPPDR